MVIFRERLDGNVLFARTNGINGYLMVLRPSHLMFFSPLTIAFIGFSMVLGPFNHWFQWYSMVVDHWSNDVMVSSERSSLDQAFIWICQQGCNGLRVHWRNPPGKVFLIPASISPNITYALMSWLSLLFGWVCQQKKMFAKRSYSKYWMEAWLVQLMFGCMVWLELMSGRTCCFRSTFMTWRSLPWWLQACMLPVSLSLEGFLGI